MYFSPKMKNTLIALGVILSSFSFQSQTNYYPLRIVSKPKSVTGYTTYILMTAKILKGQINAGNSVFLALPTIGSTSNTSLVDINTINNYDPNNNTYIYDIEQLKGYNASTGEVIVNVPQVESGRVWISINNKVVIPINSSKQFVDPDLGNPSNPNINILFDKFEFTYDAEKKMNLNLTAVDFISIPMSLYVGKTRPTDPLKVFGSQLGKQRSFTMNNIAATIRNNERGNLVWEKSLIQTRTVPVKGGTSGQTVDFILRIVAPDKSAPFPDDYLSANFTLSNGKTFNYIQSLIKFYQLNQLAIDCSDLLNNPTFLAKYNLDINTPGNRSEKDLIFYGSITKGSNNFVFTNKPVTANFPVISEVIDLTNVKSNQFFGPGQAPFDTPNETVRASLVKRITAAFSVNLLPAPKLASTDPFVTLNDAYFLAQKPNYFTKNPVYDDAPFVKGFKQYVNVSGPFYDVYSQGIHAGTNNIYGFSYDDVIKIDGTLASKDVNQGMSVEIATINQTIPTLPKGGPDALAVTNVKTTGFKRVGGKFNITVNYTIPANQIADANYFILPCMPSGSTGGFTISPEKMFAIQRNQGLSTSGTIILSIDENDFCNVTSNDCKSFNSFGVSVSTLSSTALAKIPYVFDPVNPAAQLPSSGCIAPTSTSLKSLVLGHTTENEFTSTKVYPNPVSDKLFIELEINSKLSIINVLGQVVFSSELINGENSVSVDSLKEGIYTVIIENENSKELFRITKK